MDEDFKIDDILKELSDKKKKKSKPKGNRGESQLCKLLMKTWPGELFSRVMGSGNRWAQTNLTESAKKVLTGDIVCPDNFKFCIECKHGYPEIDLCAALERDHPKLDEFLEQATRDAERIGRKPLLVWKKDYQPWVVFFHVYDLDIHGLNLIGSVQCMTYKGWYIVSLENLLSLPKDAFFNLNETPVL